MNRTAGNALLAALFLTALAGCATGKVANTYFTLDAAPPEAVKLAAAGEAVSTTVVQTPLGRLYCNSAEIRPSYLSTQPVTACFDAKGNFVLGGVGTGLSVVGAWLQGAQVVATGAQAVAIPLAAKMIGNKMIDAAKVIDGATINAVTTGTVSGTVNVGAIPPVTVSPVTGTLKLLAP